MPLTGFFGGTLENFRTALANCPAFRTWTATANVAAAKARIHACAEVGTGLTHPYCVITYGDGMGITKNSPSEFSPRTGGTINFYFEALVGNNFDTNPEADLETFCNTVEAILLELMNLAGTNTYLDIQALDMVEEPLIVNYENTRKAQGAATNITAAYTWLFTARLP